jgi:hypothetical protein
MGGLTIQFAEGRWAGRQHDEIGEGVALSEDAFDLVEPSLRSACPEWTPMHRYGVFELPIGAVVLLASLLRIEAKRRSEATCGAEKNVELLQNLSDWLDARRNGGPLSILGI